MSRLRQAFLRAYATSEHPAGGFGWGDEGAWESGAKECLPFRYNYPI